MPLAALQQALAHLYTDERARARFRSDPEAFARSFELAPAELAQLSSIGEARLHVYCDSLDRKRANECARTLPLSAAAFGPLFRREFVRYARKVPLGAGARRYRDDAAAFATFLSRSAGVGVCAPAFTLLRFEANFGCGVRFYRYFVPDLARLAARGDSIETAEAVATLVVRFLGRTFALRFPSRAR